MEIVSLHFENFRGVRDGTYEFSGRTSISGKNGSGKSTIASGYFWLMNDRDYSLVANPQVRTIGAIDEVVTTVTGDFRFDGKPVQLKKMQKLKRSKTGTISLTNSYEINSVPKSEKAFKEYLEELKFDFEKFLPCSHPGVLLAGINNKKDRDKLRSLLFQMASNVTDLDVAKDDPELAGIYQFLVDYKAEEIEAMQNNTLRVIRENYGKEGEILRAKIEGLEAAKVDGDEKEHKDAIAALTESYLELNASLDALQKEMAEAKDSVNLMNMRFALKQMESDAVKDLTQERQTLVDRCETFHRRKYDIEREINYAETRLRFDRESLEEWTEKREKNISILEKRKEEVFNEESAVCPTCGQKLPKKAKDKAKFDYEAKKQQTIKRFEEVIADQSSQIAICQERIKNAEAEISEKKKELKSADKIFMDAEKKLELLPSIPIPDMSDNDEYQKLVKEITDAEKKLEGVPAIREKIAQVEHNMNAVKSQMTEHQMALSKLEQNKVIDSRIDELRDAQINYEQKKATAEMIKDQLKTLNMKKNKMLQDSVNKNFNLISWRLWDVLKNGEYRDTCIPMIQGKSFGESMNTGLETAAKIDAINGIQKFFGLDYPIWLDNAEHLDSENLAKLDTDHQLIVLKVTDDEGLEFKYD